MAIRGSVESKLAYPRWCYRMEILQRISWWGRRESNPHGLLHKFLRLARLPFRHVPTLDRHTGCVKDFLQEIVAYSCQTRKPRNH